MSLSAERLSVLFTLFESVDRAFDFVPKSPPPTPAARIRGTLRNARAILKVLEGQLETREPKPADVDDLRRIRMSIETLGADTWVTDGIGAVDLDWPSDAPAEAAGITPPAKPLRLADAIRMLVEGLTKLET